MLLQFIIQNYIKTHSLRKYKSDIHLKHSKSNIYNLNDLDRI